MPLSSRAVSALESLPRNIAGKVFTVTYRALAVNFTVACKRICIKKSHFNDLCHEATSRLFEKGFNPMEVSANNRPQDIADVEAVHSS